MPSDSVEPAPLSPRRWLHFPRSFRGLVTFWNTFTILLFTILILAGLRYGLVYAFLIREDQELKDETDEVCKIIDRARERWKVLKPADQVGITVWDGPQRALDRHAETHADRKWFGVVCGGDGTVLAQTGLPPIPIPRTDPGASKKLQLQTIGSFRTSRRYYAKAGSEPVLVFVGSSMDSINESVTRFTQLSVVAGAVLLLLAPIGGFWLAGRVIRPLAAVISATEKLRPSNIQERLPIRETRDELDQLSMTINGLLDRIADYLARNRDLTANAAHELRSPIAAILTSAEVALHQERPVEEYKDLLASIIDECTRLGSIVQQLLLLSESDAGRLERIHTPVALDQLVRRAADMFEGVADAEGVSLAVIAPEEVVVLGDAGLLRQVIFNLIDNALKFTLSGSVRVEVTADDHKNGVLTVVDSGIGIPPENLDKVFDRFYRGEHARTRLKVGGSGLGLSICKAIVTSCGGTINVTSEAGQGTTVRVTLPSAISFGKG